MYCISAITQSACDQITCSLEHAGTICRIWLARTVGGIRHAREWQMFNAHDVTKEFEQAVAAYCGAPFAVSTTSCTMAIQIVCAWYKSQGFDGTLSMPKHSYLGVPASILNAGLKVEFRDEDWQGEYQLMPLPVWDSARRATADMYRPGAMQCLSLHWSKILGLSQGGLIIHDSPDADAWMKKYRFDGRTEGVDPKHDQVLYPSVHAYLSPEVAAHGLMKLSLLPRHNADLPRSDYPDLSLLKAFQ